MTGSMPDEIVLFGIEPESLATSLQMSEAVEKNIETLVDMIANELDQLAGSEMLAIIDAFGDPANAQQLRVRLEAGGLAPVEIHQDDALEFLSNERQPPFDVVFLDPPFAAAMLGELCRLLDERAVLRNGSLVYLEEDRATPAVELPENWSVLKSKTAGNVRYSLAEVGSDA